MERTVITVNLPGFGDTLLLADETSIRTLTDATIDFLNGNKLMGIDVVGRMMGAELVRRAGVPGTVVSFNPGGF